MKNRQEPVNKNALKALQLQEQGEVVEATRLFRKVLATSPTDWISLFSLGRILLYDGNPGEALKLIDRLLIVKRGFAPAHFLRAAALDRLERLPEAIAAIDKGLGIEPQNVDEINHRGALLSRLGKAEEAVAAYRQALTVDPAHQRTLSFLGDLLWVLKRFEEARAMFDRLLTINPDFPYAKGLIAYIRLQEADWEGLDRQIEEIDRDIADGRRSCMSLAYMAMSDSAGDQLRCARIYASDAYPEPKSPVYTGQTYEHDRIRIAYVSADFREHPVGHLMAGVIERHDPSRFETIAISLGSDDGSALRRRFERAFERFVDARSLDADGLARLFGALEVDIAIDLSGYTHGARPDIFARRVAPIQVNFLGFPGTMGARFMDYILADRHVIPDSDRLHYAEQVAYLPDTYLPTDAELQISDRTPSRSEAGLPARGIVFCSFNHVFKINPKIFGIWMDLLRDTADSVLWLSRHEPAAVANLRKEAARRGVDPQRLVFADRAPLVADHLARYRLADLFLDTAPYNAHTTAADALFAGLPVITLSGRTFAGRVAGSLLNAVGLPELIADSPDRYRQLALELANDANRLAALKERLRNNRVRFPLFDTARYCRHLEIALTTMFDRHKRGEAPASFAVAPLPDAGGGIYQR